MITIKKLAYNHGFVLANINILNDSRLSLAAKGLMTFLLTLPNNVKINEYELEKYSNDDAYSIYDIFKELSKLGYCIIIGKNYLIYETPIKVNNNGNN